MSPSSCVRGMWIPTICFLAVLTLNIGRVGQWRTKGGGGTVADGAVRPGPLVLGGLEMAASSLGQIVNKPLKTPSAYLRGSLGLEAP